MPIMRSHSLWLSLFCATAAACSGGTGSGGNPGADGSVSGDGDGGTTDGGPSGDAGQGDCVEVSDFANLGVIDGNVVKPNPTFLSIDSTLEAGPPMDFLLVELYGGDGVFAQGLATGTYQITGEETDYDTCDLCVTVYGDFDPMSGSEMIYIAQSGTVNITSIEGNFAGSFVPSGPTTSFLGQVYDRTTSKYNNTNCAVNGGGFSWDKAIPAQ